MQCSAVQVRSVWGSSGRRSRVQSAGGRARRARPGFHMQRSGSYKRATRIIAIAVTPPASSPPRLLCSALQQAVSGSYTPLPPLARVPPPRLFPRLRSPAVTHYSLTNSLTHALTHSLTHCTIHSHSRSLTRFSLRSPFTQIIQLVRS